jgi:molecular chaperone DnaK (HSP70)
MDGELDLDNWIHEAQGWADSRGILHIPKGMTALQVIAKYLSYLRDALWRRLGVKMSTAGGNLDRTPIQFWFTVPVSWSDTTRKLMREVISDAGFGARDGDQVHLLTEPQAAMTFALAKEPSLSVHIVSSALHKIWS